MADQNDPFAAIAEPVQSGPMKSPYAKGGSYTTTLSPQDEQQFQGWVKAKKIPFDPSPTSDYDMRGYYKDNVLGNGGVGTKTSAFDGRPHFPDTYKTPYHKTFSNESRYATPDAPHWQGDRLIDKNGKVIADETPKGKGSASGDDDDPFAAIAETPKAPPPSTNGATIQAAAPKGRATQFLEDLSNDLRQGGSRTVVGRTLGKLQGRGDKGFEGLESGTTPATADFLGSVPLGAVKTAQGIVETPEHPIAGPLKAVSGVAQMATIPSMMMGGPGASAAIEAAPSRKFAAELFKDVSEHAGDVPVQLNNAGNELMRFKELADAGGAMPKAAKRLLNRAMESYKPGGKPLTYDEARDIYSNLSSLSAEDASRLNPVMRRQMGITVQALKKDIGDAADQAGQAAKYYAALKNYGQASKLLRASKNIQDFLAKPLVKKTAEGLGLGAGGALGYELYNKMK